MTEIRPLRADDIGELARLFQITFRNPRLAPPPTLITYLRQLYLEMPGFEPEIQSLVHEDDRGAITGFIGVNVLPMQYEERKLRAAVCGSFMVKDHTADPMAGARLLRAFLAGSQDISFSETASEVSTRMWTSLRGIALPSYSLDWVRVTRPASFMVSLAGGALKPLRFTAPLARCFDRFYCGRMTPDRMRWVGVPAVGPSQGGLSVSQIDRAQFAALIEPLTRHYPLRPDWREAQLDAILADAEQKIDYGDAVFCQVVTSSGAIVGAFFYHLKPGEIARVLQILARPGQTGAVVDCLIGDVASRGAGGLRGRIQPDLMEVMLGRRISFTHLASTVVHSHDAALMEACRAGKVFFNGLAGENWMRLMGDRFD